MFSKASEKADIDTCAFFQRESLSVFLNNIFAARLTAGCFLACIRTTHCPVNKTCCLPSSLQSPTSRKHSWKAKPSCFPFHLWHFLDLLTIKLSIWIGDIARWWWLPLTSAGRTVAMLVLPDLCSIRLRYCCLRKLTGLWSKSGWHNPRRSR